MNRNLSLTNSKDVIANSVAIISGNDVVDLFDLFLTIEMPVILLDLLQKL